MAQCVKKEMLIIFSAKGFDTTIMDFSEEQLNKNRLVAERENIIITTVQADMTRTFPFVIILIDFQNQIQQIYLSIHDIILVNYTLNRM
ncbi:hypothetical protein [Macrococcus capreoli]|uniref:hypothetical protein n=1 Tax=Macrococcus capreoli TaxID=2982690 RepID=UPI003EE80AB7